jgi:hypothetical protein
MYILVNKNRMLMGLFTTKKNLNLGLAVMRANEPNCIAYYQKVDVNMFDSNLFQFWTMHPEKLIEIDREVNHV